MLKERSQSFKLIFIGLDLMNALLSVAFSFILRYYILDPSGQDRLYIDFQSYIYLGLLLSAFQILVFLSIDLYHPRRGLSFADELLTIVWGVGLNLIVVLALLFFFRGESFSRLFIGYFGIINVVLTAIVHFGFRSLLASLREKGYNLRNVLVLGVRETAWNFTEVIEKHHIYGYKIQGYLSGRTRNPIRKSMKVLGRVKDIEKILRQFKPDLVVYAMNTSEGDYLRDAIDDCDTEGIDFKIIPSFQEFITARGRVEDIDGVPVITIRNIPIRLGYNRVVKRSFDLLFSSIFLLVFSPVFLLLSLAILVTSGRPVFHRQERVGLDNKPFYMLKFRTMVVQKEEASATLWTKKNDPRVTKIGALLRKTSLDEIPQFFNVLLGDMSVVGPRPERPFFVDKFKNQHKHYMRRHAVKAGITGWAQIQGWRGDTSIEKRIEADIYYIENWSLFLDLKIILLTPWKGLMNKNAY